MRIASIRILFIGALLLGHPSRIRIIACGQTTPRGTNEAVLSGPPAQMRDRRANGMRNDIHVLERISGRS